MKELIDKLKEDIKYCKDCEMPLDWVSFTTGIGVLISANEAQQIVDILEAKIVEQPAITDPESLDNTLSQHEEVEGYEFVNGVGGSVDCNNCASYAIYKLLPFLPTTHISHSLIV